jgi:hypothetical protein
MNMFMGIGPKVETKEAEPKLEIVNTSKPKIKLITLFKSILQKISK